MIYALGDLQRLTGATRSRLTFWTKSRLLRPSVHEADGTGTRQLFDWFDLCRCMLLVSLDECGVKSSDMRSIVSRVADHSWAAPPPERNEENDVFLLVESVRKGRIRRSRGASFEEAVKKRPHVLGVNLSALQRILWSRVQNASRRH